MEISNTTSNYTEDGLSENLSNLTFISRSTEDEVDSLTTKQITLIIILGLITILTIVANAFVLYIFLVGKKRLRTPTNLLLANMAVADLLVGIFVMPMLASTTILDGKWLFGDFGCKAFDYIHFLLCGSSMWSMIGVWVDRYIGVSRPLQYKFLVTQRRTYYLIVGIWTAAFLVTSVPLTYWRMPLSGNPHICWGNFLSHFLIFVAVFAYCIPVSGSVIICWIVYRNAVKPLSQKSLSRSDSAEQAKSKETKLAKTIAIVTGTLVIFYSPVFFTFLIKALDLPYFSSDLLVTSAWIRYSCSTVDPFMYGLAVPGYRQEIRERYFRSGRNNQSSKRSTETTTA